MRGNNDISTVNENIMMAHVQATGVITARLRQNGCPAESIEWLVALFSHHKNLMLSAHEVLYNFEIEQAFDNGRDAERRTAGLGEMPF